MHEGKRKKKERGDAQQRTCVREPAARVLSFFHNHVVKRESAG